MRCPVVAQAACLVEGSNQHRHRYYYHRHRGLALVQILGTRIVLFSLVVCECVCGELVWAYACRPGEKMKTLAVLGCTAVTQDALLVEGGGNQHHYHRRGGHYYYYYFRDS